MDKQIYESGFGNDRKYYVNGPGKGLGYYSGTLYPQLRWDSEENAKKSAEIANIAYHEGYEAARRNIRQLLGIEKD